LEDDIGKVDQECSRSLLRDLSLPCGVDILSLYSCFNVAGLFTFKGTSSEREGEGEKERKRGRESRNYMTFCEADSKATHCHSQFILIIFLGRTTFPQSQREELGSIF
jgi:hypothetical protein